MLPKFKCKRCGHSWVARVENPVMCPYCHSPYWNKVRVRFFAVSRRSK